jgi:serine O-acetyltransferase
MNLIKLIQSDLARYQKVSVLSFIKRILLDTNYTSVFLYRVSSYLYVNKVPLFPKLIMNINKILFSIEISYAAKIQKGFRINHSVGIVIGSRVQMGENITINQGVTIGGNFNKKKIVENTLISQPIVGDNVSFSAGCKVLGPIVIGDNVVIGANSVVITDVKQGVKMVGVPGKPIKSDKEDQK